MSNNSTLATMQRMATDPAYFRSQLIIEVSGDVVRYDDVKAPWQEADFVAMDPAWLRSVGRTKSNVTPMRSLLERCRGASKTSDLAIMACWALAFATFPARLISASGAKDQARLLRDAIRRLAELNPWLGAMLEVNQYTVRNTRNGAELEILSSEGATNFGQLCDAVLVDELHNWPDTESAQHFWHVVSSTITKKQNCVCLVISNAGRVDSWQWLIREAIREDSNWYFHALKETPSWITEKSLAEQKRLLPPNVYARLWENKWSSGTDTGLSPADVDACTVLPGPEYRRGSQHDIYIAACDLGWRHDRTGLVVLKVNYERGQIALAHCESWLPQDHGGELPLSIVENALLEVHGRFNLDQLVFDPREATGLAQRLCDQGLPCARMNLSPAVQNDMAKIFLQAFNQRLVQLYPHADLIRDLLSMAVVDRTIGLKLQAARTSGGHSDLGFAFAMALTAAWNYQANDVQDEVLIA